MTSATLARPAYAVGNRVRYRPETNPGMNDYRANDRGTVYAVPDYDEKEQIQYVSVLWDSVLSHADPDTRISEFARLIPAVRIVRTFTEEVPGNGNAA